MMGVASLSAIAARGLDAAAIHLQRCQHLGGPLALGNEGGTGLALIRHCGLRRVRPAALGRPGDDAVDRRDPPVDVGHLGGGHLEAAVQFCCLQSPHPAATARSPT
jgi:hypothetical protein